MGLSQLVVDLDKLCVVTLTAGVFVLVVFIPHEPLSHLWVAQLAEPVNVTVIVDVSGGTLPPTPAR